MNNIKLTEYLQKIVESDPPNTEEDLVFTPIAPDGLTRLQFKEKNVKVLIPRTRKKGGVVEIAGEQYVVKARPCGAACYCDAQITGKIGE